MERDLRIGSLVNPETNLRGWIFIWCKEKFRGKAIAASIIVVLGLTLVTGSNCYADTDTVPAVGLKSRSNIEEQYQWKLEDIYADETAWDAECTKIKDDYIPRISKLKGTLKDAEALLKCLELSDEIDRKMDKLYVYAKTKSDISAVHFLPRLCMRNLKNRFMIGLKKGKPYQPMG
jgi:hypothetical protein